MTRALLALFLTFSCSSPPPATHCEEQRERFPPKAGGWCDCECQRGECRSGFVCWPAAPPDGGGFTVGCDWYASDAGSSSTRCSP